MKRTDLSKKIPGKSGVYFFLGKKREVLYIGKATALKSRIMSYFDSAIKEKRSAVIEKMTEEAKTVEWTATDSVLEAMLLETNLIRTHKPRYNTRSKDDKSFNHVIITKEEYPQVLVVRAKDIQGIDESEYLKVYGPFPNGALFREALKIMRKLFQYYDIPVEKIHKKQSFLRGKLNFNRQIGLYPTDTNKEEYQKTIRHIQLFFEGKKYQIIAELEKEMMLHAKRQEFEVADRIKRKIFALKHIQDIALLKDETRVYSDERSIRIEGYDIAHLQGTALVGVMTVAHGGSRDPSAYRTFHIKSHKGNDDVRSLKEILQRRFMHTEWLFPQLIVVDGSTAQKNAAESVLREHHVVIPVVGVVKDEHHKPKRIIGAQKLIEAHRDTILLVNAEAHRFALTFHKKTRRKGFLNSS